MDSKKIPEKRAKNITVSLSKNSLPIELCSKVLEATSKNNYKLNHQAWIKDDKNIIKGYLQFSIAIGYTTKKFKDCISSLFDLTNTEELIIETSNPNDIIKEMLKMNTETLQQQGTNILNHFDKTNKSSSGDKSPRLLKNIQDGNITSLEQIKQITIDEGLSDVSYMRAKKYYQDEIRESLENKRKQSFEQWKEIEETKIFGESWYKVCIWCNMVIRKDVVHRKKHLWLYGPSNMGKSTRFLNELKKRLNTWEILKDKIQNNPYISGRYDLIYADEYNKPYKDVSFLQEITNPQQSGIEGMKIRQPGGTTHEKTDFPPVIIISNCKISELYKGLDETLLKTLQERFYEIYIDQRGNPFNISDEDNKSQKLMDEKMNSSINSEFTTPNIKVFDIVTQDKIINRKRKVNEHLENESNNESRKKSNHSISENITNVSKSNEVDLTVSEEEIDYFQKELLKNISKEEECRKIFEDKFGLPFKKIRHPDIVNPDTGELLELDGYNEYLKLAFEYQGFQHYYYPNKYHKSQKEFDDQVKRDQYKVQRCKELGITLIVISYKHKRHLNNFITEELKSFEP